jgi:predicted nuclease with TOPRIM domain
MQDDGILTFIQDLELNEEKRYIYDELEAIKHILGHKKRKACKYQFGGGRTIQDLKHEVSRLEDEKNCLSDESEIISSENEELKSRLETMNMEL